jgi:hypothetical protein
MNADETVGQDKSNDKNRNRLSSDRRSSYEREELERTKGLLEEILTLKDRVRELQQARSRSSPPALSSKRIQLFMSYIGTLTTLN